MQGQRIPSFVRVGALLALVLMPVLGACTKGGQFDPTEVFNSDAFDSKKKLSGQREPVFPSGVPGTTTGVPAGSRQRLSAAARSVRRLRLANARRGGSWRGTAVARKRVRCRAKCRDRGAGRDGGSEAQAETKTQAETREHPGACSERPDAHQHRLEVGRSGAGSGGRAGQLAVAGAGVTRARQLASARSSAGAGIVANQLAGAARNSTGAKDGAAELAEPAGHDAIGGASLSKPLRYAAQRPPLAAPSRLE